MFKLSIQSCTKFDVTKERDDKNFIKNKNPSIAYRSQILKQKHCFCYFYYHGSGKVSICMKKKVNKRK